MDYPEKIYANERIGTNGIVCLDYRNRDEDVEYIRADIVSSPVEPEVRQVCEWTLTNYGLGDYYETGCNNNGTDAEEDMYNYCPYCGGEIMSKSA